MTEPHLDLDALADLLVGEGDDTALAHLSGCTACSAALADLDAAQPAVDALLREEAARPLPAPPADLVPALLARLPEGAGERTAVSTGTGGTGAGGSTVLPGTVTPLPQRAPRRPRVLGAAAAAVALLAVVGAGVALSRDGSGSDDTASSAVASAPAADLPVRASGSDYTDAASVARVLPALLGAATAGEAAGSTASDTTGAGAGAALPDTATSTPGSGGTTGGAAAGTPDPAAAAAAPVAPSAALDPLARLRVPEELAGCLGELTGPDDDVVPLALDYARYRGAPALAVVLPSARADKVDVFVVGAGCRAGDDQTLFFTRQPRP